MEYLEHVTEIKKKIKETDRILVGLGKEFSCFVEDGVNFHIDQEKKEQVLAAYQMLAKQLQGKDYFIVTLCMDDVIYESALSEDRIVAPCGSLKQLQCPDSCNDVIYMADTIPEDHCCPECGKELVGNNVYAQHYNENGYLPKWKAYTAWIQMTMNRNLVALDLGTGMQFPSIIRFPVEKLVLYNEKAWLVRVNEIIFQIPQEISQKAYSYERNAVAYLQNEFV